MSKSTAAATAAEATATNVPRDTLVLQYPFTNAAGERIEKLTIRRGKRADLRAAAQFSDNEAAQESFLFARLTGLTMEDIDELDLVDNAALVRRFRQGLEPMGNSGYAA